MVSAVTRIQVSDPQRLSVIRRGNHLLFRDMTAGPSYGALAFASLDDQGERVSTGLPCARLHASRNRAVCLAVEQRPSIGHRAYVLQDLDHHPEVVRALDLPGLPSRVRVSGDGRLAAYTVFVAGDSYLSAGFSTRTRLLDLETGRELGDLEQRHVTKGQSRFQAVDQNFWGITFAPDASRFFATLGTGGRLFLVMGEPASQGPRGPRRGHRVPVALARRHEDRVQAHACRERAAPLAAGGPRVVHEARDAPSRSAQRGRPDRMARRRPRAVRPPRSASHPAKTRRHLEAQRRWSRGAGASSR